MLASTQPTVAVTVDPSLIVPPPPGRSQLTQTAEIVSRHLGMSQEKLIPLLTTPNTNFVYLKKKVPALTYGALASELSQRGIYGVFREADPQRVYPNHFVGAAITGFVGADGLGQGGLERSFNRELSGVEGVEKYESSPNGSKIPLGRSSLKPAVNGYDIQTTIDSELQWSAEKLLSNAVTRTKSDWGVAITMDVKSGEVLAMANAPTFDSNKSGSTKAKLMANRAISYPYEPGSVEKVLTSAALIDAKVAKPTTKVVIPSRLASGGASIGDHFTHGELRYNMRGVIANSSNIGTALLTRQLPKQTLHDYLTSFGLGASTGIELPGESVGIAPAADMTDGQRDQVAFGQALSVTAIQEAAAIGGIINDGVYNPPTVIKSAKDADGKPVTLGDREPRQVVSAKTSASVRNLMRAVVDSPNGQRNLSLADYPTGGKTGTAQRADTKCGCYKGYVTSYVGFAPLNDPKILTYVVLSHPRRGDTGTATAAPVYREIMNVALPRYSIAPSAAKHEPQPTEW